MMLMKKIALAGLMLGAVVACKPTNDGDNNNGGGDDNPVAPNFTVGSIKATTSSYEDFITRTEEKATIAINVNDGFLFGEVVDSDDKDVLVWMVGVQIVKSGEKVDITPANYGAGSSNVLFNWYKGVYAEVIELDDPLPLAVPLLMNINTEDPGVKYLPELSMFKTDSIEIIYEELLKNSTNKNKAGNLFYASAWSKLGYKPGDNVDLVVSIYSMDQSNTWYTNKFMVEKLPVSEILKQATLQEVVELQRFSGTLGG